MIHIKIPNAFYPRALEFPYAPKGCSCYLVKCHSFYELHSTVEKVAKIALVLQTNTERTHGAEKHFILLLSTLQAFLFIKSRSIQTSAVFSRHFSFLLSHFPGLICIIGEEAKNRFISLCCIFKENLSVKKF